MQQLGGRGQKQGLKQGCQGTSELICQSAGSSDCGQVLDAGRMPLSRAEVGSGAQEPHCGVLVSADKTAKLREHLARWRWPSWCLLWCNTSVWFSGLRKSARTPIRVSPIPVLRYCCDRDTLLGLDKTAKTLYSCIHENSLIGKDLLVSKGLISKCMWVCYHQQWLLSFFMTVTVRAAAGWWSCGGLQPFVHKPAVRLRTETIS